MQRGDSINAPQSDAACTARTAHVIAQRCLKLHLPNPNAQPPALSSLAFASAPSLALICTLYFNRMDSSDTTTNPATHQDPLLALFGEISNKVENAVPGSNVDVSHVNGDTGDTPLPSPSGRSSASPGPEGDGSAAASPQGRPISGHITSPWDGMETLGRELKRRKPLLPESTASFDLFTQVRHPLASVLQPANNPSDESWGTCASACHAIPCCTLLDQWADTCEAGQGVDGTWRS